MDTKNIDIVKSMPEMIWKFCLSPELWEAYISGASEIDFSKIVKIPYFDGDSTKLSKEVSEIPNKSGGIYIYTIENPVVKDTGRYIMYVGRALLTKSENLRARARSHFYQYQRGDENDRLTRLYNDWAKYIYLLYIPIDENNEVIREIEEELIVSLAPPCNKDYPAVKIRKKLSAFQYS